MALNAVVVAKHGDVSRVPEEALANVGECDWGECDALATCFRYDAHGHGWLPCCDACAAKPVVP